MGDEVCGICLEPLAQCAHVGRLDGCTHRYCVACIAEWAKIANVCPQCKARFHAVREGSATEVVLRVRYADNLCESRLQRASLRELTAGWTAVDHRELRRVLESFGFVYRRGDYVAAPSNSNDDDDDDAALDADDPAFVVPDRPRPRPRPRPRSRRHRHTRTPSPSPSPSPSPPPAKHARRRVVDSDTDTDTDTDAE